MNTDTWRTIAEMLAVKSELNDEQRSALAAPRNCSVTAAAGSGKTRILTARYVLLLLAEKKLNPQNLVAITFTENAAAEMRSRIRSLIRSLLNDPDCRKYHKQLTEIYLWLTLAHITTIHAFCRTILSEFPLDAGLAPGFATSEETRQFIDQNELVDSLLREIDQQDVDVLDAEECLLLGRYLNRKRLRNILLAILESRAQVVQSLDTMRDIDSYTLREYRTKKDKVPAELELRLTRLLARVADTLLDRYEEHKLQHMTLDFDDLLIRCADMIMENSEVRDSLSRRFHYFLIDEFQDTNPLQWKIVRALSRIADSSLHPRKIFIVGDPKQSIYGFRDADVRIFYHAQKEIDAGKEQGDTTSHVIMNRNYRARQRLVDFSNRLFSRLMITGENKKRQNEFEVEYQPLRKARDYDDAFDGAVEVLLETGDVEQEETNEVNLIAHRILQLVQEGDGHRRFGYSDITILLRWTTHLLDLEAALRQHDIPYVTIGGIGFYKRQEVWDVYHLLSFLLNPQDDLALAGILRSPLFGLTDNVLYKIARTDSQETSFYQKLKAYDTAGRALPLTQGEARAVEFTRTVLDELLLKANQTEVAVLLEDTFRNTGYRISAMSLPGGKYVLANLDKLIAMAHDVPALPDFVERLKLYIEGALRESEAQPELVEEDAVRIMTIHRAKGLEFPVVFLPFLHQGFDVSQRRSELVDADLFIGCSLRNPENNMQFDKTSLLRTIKEREKKRTEAEEKRLLYVGVTRAEDFLILSGKAHTGRPWVTTPFTFISKALEFKKEEAPEQVPFIENGSSWNITVRTSIPHATAPGAPRAERGTVGEVTKDEIVPFLEPISPRVVPFVLSATELERIETGFHILEEKKMYPALYETRETLFKKTDETNETAMLVGTLVHKCLELLVTNRGLEIETLVENLVREQTQLKKHERETLEQVTLRKVKQTYQSQMFGTLLQSREIFPELPFQLRLDSDILITGKIDVLWNDPSTSHWSVLDYKTDAAPGDKKALREYATRHYGNQMLAYALFVNRAFPDQYRIPTTLFFTTPGTAVEYHFTKEDLHGYETTIAKTIRKMFSNKKV